MMKRILFFLPVLCVVLTANAQEKKYKVAIVGFYNLENLYDTLDDPSKDDAEFLPNGSYRYTGTVYKDKLNHLSDVISLIGTDASPDGLAIMGCAEIENDTVLTDLINTPKLESRHYKIVHYNSPDIRGVDVAMLYNPKYFTPKYSAPLFVPLFESDSVTPRYTRDALYVEGQLMGEPVYVFVNHWPSRRGGEEASAPYRAIAAGVCRHKMDSILDKN